MSDNAQAGTDSTDAGGTQTAAQATPPADSSTTLTATPPAADAKAPAVEAKPDASNADAKDAPKADDKPADKDGKPKADDAPIDYKFELPKDVTIDETRLGEFTTIAKDLKLPADAAQKIVDLAVAQQKAAVQAHVEQVKAWGSEVAADKEIGKPENQALARKAVEQFGSPALKTLLNETGIGNHPELVRLMYQVGKAISEDKVIVGRGDAPAAPRDPAAVLYPNQA